MSGPGRPNHVPFGCSDGVDVQGVGRVDPPAGRLEQSLADHRLRPAGSLLPGLEHEHDVTLELVAQLVQDPRRTDQPRDVQVVAAGVHPTDVPRDVLEVEVLGDRQGVHVAAQQHHRPVRPGARGAPRPRSTATTDDSASPRVTSRSRPSSASRTACCVSGRSIPISGIWCSSRRSRDEVGADGRGDVEGAHGVHASTRRGTPGARRQRVEQLALGLRAPGRRPRCGACGARRRASSLAESWKLRIDASDARPADRAHTRALRRPGHRRQHLHLARREPARVGVRAEVAADEPPLAATGPHHERDERQEDRHLDEQVDRDQPGASGDGSEVPDGVQQHGEERSPRSGASDLEAPGCGWSPRSPMPMPVMTVNIGWANGVNRQRAMNVPVRAPSPPSA